AVVGAVSTVFVLLSALAAPVAIALARRWGSLRVALLSLCLITLAHGLIAGWGAGQIWLAVAAAGLGGGMVGAITPALVSTLLPARAGLGVAVFMVGNSAGFYAASVAVAWTIERFAAWHLSAIPSGVVALCCAAVWAGVVRLRRGSRAPSATVRSASPGVAVRRAPVPAWMRALVVFLCLQTISVFSLIAWVAPSAEAAGASASTAATMLGLLSALQVISGVGLPLIAQRWQRSGLWVVVSALAVLGGTALFAISVVHRQDVAGGWPAVALMALGHGGSFAMANYLVAARAGSENDAIRFGALMMLWSQLAGALGPLLLGAVRDQAGGYPAVWWVLTGIGAVMLAGALGLLGFLRRDEGRPL
ncbi:MAG: MFS transporter, partial [Propionibacteriaceae bacterium]|nr:MFS transporter [Propionibacteriaceae bacterium]